MEEKFKSLIDGKKLIVLIFVLIFSFSGCSWQFLQGERAKYNEGSQRHEELIKQASSLMDKAITDYNNHQFDDAISNATRAKDFIIKAQDKAKELQDIAGKISGVPWLPDFQSKVVQIESKYVNIIDLVISASQASKKGDTTQANKDNQKIGEILKEIEAISADMNKIKSEHSDFFK